MGYRTKVRGYRIKDGKLVPCNKHKDVSARLRERGSKKVRDARTACSVADGEY